MHSLCYSFYNKKNQFSNINCPTFSVNFVCFFIFQFFVYIQLFKIFSTNRRGRNSISDCLNDLMEESQMGKYALEYCLLFGRPDLLIYEFLSRAQAEDRTQGFTTVTSFVTDEFLWDTWRPPKVCNFIHT